jgi:hypothetical protein
MKKFHLLIASFASALVPPGLWYLAISMQSPAEREYIAENGGEPFGHFILLSPVIFFTGVVFSYFLLKRKKSLGRLDLFTLIKTWLLFFGPPGLLMALGAEEFGIFFRWLTMCILTPTVAWIYIKFFNI